MVSYATKHNIYSAKSSSIHYLTDANCKKRIESGLSRLVISIDGVSQGSHGKYRIGGKRDKVIDGTKNMIKWKKATGSKTPFIIWEFIVFGNNEGDIEEIRQLAKEVGVDYPALKMAQIYNFERGSNVLSENPKNSRYEKKGPR